MGCEQSIPIEHQFAHHSTNREVDPDEVNSLSDIIRKYQNLNLTVNSDPDPETVHENAEFDDVRDGLPVSSSEDIRERLPTKSNDDDAGVRWYNRMPTEVTRTMLDFGGKEQNSNDDADSECSSYQGVPWYNRMPTGVTRDMLDFGEKKEPTVTISSNTKSNVYPKVSLYNRTPTKMTSSSSSAKANDDAKGLLYNRSSSKLTNRSPTKVTHFDENKTNDPHDHQGDGSTTSGSGTTSDSTFASNDRADSPTMMRAKTSDTTAIPVKPVAAVDDIYDDFSKYNYYAVDFNYLYDVYDSHDEFDDIGVAESGRISRRIEL